MAILFASASSQYLHHAAIPLGSTIATTPRAWTFSCWVKPTTSNAAQAYMGFATGANNVNQFYIGINSSGAPLATRSATSTQTATATGAVTNGKWTHVCGVFVSGTIYIYNDVGNAASAASAVFPAALTGFSIGRVPNASANNFADAAIGRVGVWAAALGLPEIERLAAGEMVRNIRPRSLVCDLPCNRNGLYQCRKSGRIFTPTASPTLVGDPPILRRGGKQIV